MTNNVTNLAFLEHISRAIQHIGTRSYIKDLTSYQVTGVKKKDQPVQPDTIHELPLRVLDAMIQEEYFSSCQPIRTRNSRTNKYNPPKFIDELQRRFLNGKKTQLQYQRQNVIST